ncbi:MAG: ATP-dependent Clp protease ATP-binding subunit [Clostridiales bacterium]|nr:ATP-dependent Clp protease ATP-binding subunit [Clostridiales bacterium]
MTKCVICKKNVAVVFTTRIENGKRISEGLCLKCAYQTGIGGIDEMFAKAGINEKNIDRVSERLNNLMTGVEGSQPEDIFKMLLGSEDLFSDNGLTESSDEFSDEEGDPPLSNLGFLEIGNQDLGGSFDMNDEALKSEDSEDISDGIPGNEKKADPSEPKQKQAADRKREPKLRFLDQFGSNLTRKAKEGKIDRIIGREKELERVIQILNRRTKNNPAILGAPGVGKTAIAEGLAVRIAEGNVPAKLLDMSVYLLDMTAMVAGTQFRGQFESRMKGVVEDAKKSDNVVLVIDELHNIMGAGDAEGAMNAANILKPALAKGEIRVIGSTTLDEYRRHIEKDSALERRFQKVIVEEPSEAESIEILKGIRDYYEDHHHVSYSDEVVEYAVKASARYIMDRFLPDKAIDLLDESGSRANLREVLLVKHKSLTNEKSEMEKDLTEIEQKIESAAPQVIEDEGLYEKQAETKAHLLRIEEELKSLESELVPTIISHEDISAVIEMWTGIPVKRISESESEKLMKLEERLHKRVIGQDDAVGALARAIRRNRSGFGKKHKPASFIFVGPTGVGKTELVKAVAEAMFAREDALIRMDMSEFMEAHTVSKLIGSPPGYVGYDDGGQLTERVRRKPYSVILFDEIEKAHPDVFNLLLQILDDGRLTDSHGRLVNFENTILIMTSNAGTTLKSNGFGFGSEGHVAMESRVQTVLKDMFRPEFLNRVDEIIVFRELSRDEIRRIVELMLKELSDQLLEKNIELRVSEKAKDVLAEEGYDVKYGARPLRKTIQRRLEDPLSDRFLTGKLDDVYEVDVDHDGNEFTFDLLRREEK